MALHDTLATLLAVGAQSVEAILARAHTAFGRRPRWLRPLALRYLDAFAAGVRPCHADVVRFLRHAPGLPNRLPKLITALFGTDQMQPHPAFHCNVPPLESIGELCQFLALHPHEIEWFADLRNLNRRHPLAHYHYRILAKPGGAPRLIEAPKPRLKEMQRRILEAILDPIPVHPAVHGFTKGRSIRTFTEPHTARSAVLKLDLQDFFPSIIGARIQALFRTLGYPEPVAALLGGICTNAAPRAIWNGTPRPTVDLYARPHLPQGAPTSPALANLCFYRADCRLNGFAKAAGATYTRYADDLAFSSDADLTRFPVHAAAIIAEEGFEVHHRKTRLMRQGVRQHLAGLTVNERLNVHRHDFDQLKAILTNCLRYGPQSQNRDNHSDFRAHLQGRIAFVNMVHPERALRLRAIYNQIDWNA